MPFRLFINHNMQKVFWLRISYSALNISLCQAQLLIENESCWLLIFFFSLVKSASVCWHFREQLIRLFVEFTPNNNKVCSCTWKNGISFTGHSHEHSDTFQFYHSNNNFQLNMINFSFTFRLIYDLWFFSTQIIIINRSIITHTYKFFAK